MAPTAYGVVAAFQASHEFGRVLAALWGVAFQRAAARAEVGPDKLPRTAVVMNLGIVGDAHGSATLGER